MTVWSEEERDDSSSFFQPASTKHCFVFLVVHFIVKANGRYTASPINRLQKFETFLNSFQISVKNISLMLNFEYEYWALTKIEKKIKILDKYNGKWRPKDQKILQKSDDPIPTNSAYPSKSWHGHPKWMKLFVVIVPPKNSISSKRNGSKVHIQRP